MCGSRACRQRRSPIVVAQTAGPRRLSGVPSPRCVLVLSLLTTACNEAMPGSPVVDGAPPVDDAPAIVDADLDAPVAEPLRHRSYLKASNTDAEDRFGWALALSADGSTLAVASPYEDGAATTIGGDATSDAAFDSGAVYVYARSGSTWTLQAYVKPSNTGLGDHFGSSLALSADGATLVVGAPYEDGGAAGVGGDPSSNATSNAGAAYVFTRTGATWTQQAYVKATNPGVNDLFGSTVALDDSGTWLAVAATMEDSAATGVDGDQAGDAASNSGAVYVFARGGQGWAPSAYLKASNTGRGDELGAALDFDAAGTMLVIGATGEHSASGGVGADQSDNTMPLAGAVYVFRRSATAWAQAAYIKAPDPERSDFFGSDVATSADGSVLVVSSPGDNEVITDSGAAYVLTATGDTWTHLAKLKAPNPDEFDGFGAKLALSADGETLTLTAIGEASASTGIDGDSADDSADNAGAAYLMTRQGATYGHTHYVKASNTNWQDGFGSAIAISGDGTVIVVGAFDEDGAGTGVGADPTSNSSEDAGAAYVYW